MTRREGAGAILKINPRPGTALQYALDGESIHGKNIHVPAQVIATTDRDGSNIAIENRHDIVIAKQVTENAKVFNPAFSLFGTPAITEPGAALTFAIILGGNGGNGWADNSTQCQCQPQHKCHQSLCHF